MWIPKWQRDLAAGVDSPLPTQVVSNGEISPRPQTQAQAAWEHRIGELAAVNSKRCGMNRRAFMRSGMGLATSLWAANEVYGQRYWQVDREEMFEPAAIEEKWPKGEYFIFDINAHFTNGVALKFRESDFMRRMGMRLTDDPASYSFQTFVKEMFLDSETDIVALAGLPGRENNLGDDGAVLEGLERGGGIAPSWLMAKRRDDINSIAGGRRALALSNCAPNHYWDSVANQQDEVALKEQMTREVEKYKTRAWNFYCHFDPARSGNGFQLDDEASAYFYEVARELGQTTVCVHKGYASQSSRFGHLANPKDVEQAALDNPDLTFVVYHSGLKHGPTEPQFDERGFFDPTTGDFAWHDVLMDIKVRNPAMDNVYCEIGSAFGTLAITHPVMAMHLMGKNIKHYGVDKVLWGTDCIWWGSPQWCIDAFKRFQISDELCEKFGYSKLSNGDKAKIFGLNAARLFGVDPMVMRRAIRHDDLAKIKMAHRGDEHLPSHAPQGLVRAGD
jgi:predicted TIM-barrel fold metal-dependent hydrolase